jgi:hypothetical protein
MNTSGITPDSSFGPTVRCLIDEKEVEKIQSPLDKGFSSPGGAQSLNYRAVARTPSKVQMDEMQTVTIKGTNPAAFHGIAMGASDPSDFYQKRSLAVIRHGSAGISADFVKKAENETLHPGDNLYPVKLDNGDLGLGTESYAVSADTMAELQPLITGFQPAGLNAQEKSAAVANLFAKMSGAVTPVAQVVGCDSSSKWVKIWLYGVN